VAVGKWGWDRQAVETDVYNELLARLNNSKAASNIRDGIVQRFNSKVKISKLIGEIKDGYKAAKDFTLSPVTIAKLCYGMLTGLFNMAMIENDLGLDLNKNDFLSDEYFDYLLYSYLTRGRMQPRHRTI
jgi:hypothetical protein